MTGQHDRPGADCWVLSDGKAGHESQSLGLAEALGFDPRVLRLSARPPWCWLPPALWVAPLRAVRAEPAALRPPWPALVIATGRITAPAAAALRGASGGATFAVQIQDPKLNPARFDLVVAPAHDQLVGDNVLESQGALTRVTDRRLAEAAAAFAARYDPLPRPRVAVLIGGKSRAYRLTEARARELAAQLAGLARDQGAGLMVTVSRRTPPPAATALRAGLAEVPAEFWDGQGPNPYFGLLALADALVVTGDSVSMACEAAGTGKPVYIAALEGGSARSARFHDGLRQAGITRPFTGRLEDWHYPPLREAERIAAQIRQRLAARAGHNGPLTPAR